MARKTIAGLEATISELEDAVNSNQELYSKAQRSIEELKSQVKSRDEEIFQLRRHVGFVHAQRDRLVGFIEGQRSITEPVAIRHENTYAPVQTEVSRVEKFIDECTLQFDNSIQDTVRNDEFRHTRRY